MDDQNVYDVIMTAINTKELTTAKLGNLLSHELNTSCRQMKRGRAIRTDMEDMDKKKWVRRSSTVPKNAIQVGKLNVSLMMSCLFYSITNLIHYITSIFRAQSYDC